MMMMVEGIKGVNNGGRVVGVGHLDEDMADGMQCTDHPYRNNPGGICAFCLQEKLGKLVSSSFPLPIRGSTSSSSSPSFRSDIGVGPSSSANSTAAAVALSLSARPGSSSSLSLNKGNNSSSGGNECRFVHREDQVQEYYSNHRRTRLPFLLAKKKKKKVTNTVGTTFMDNHRSTAHAPPGDNIVFKRSKSTTTPRRGRHCSNTNGNKFLDDHDFIHNSPRKQRGGFWSFLYLSSSSSARKIDNGAAGGSKTASFSSVTSAGLAGNSSNNSNNNNISVNSNKQKERCLGSSVNSVVEEENDSSPNSQTTASASSFERKVSRSRSVGCGSRSFSGDFFERISTGFGDCTLRRVESQREGKSKVSAAAHRGGSGTGDHQCMKERVRCGGIFGGFILTSSSSSSSSSSYWVSSSAEEMNGKSVASSGGGPGPLVNGRSRSWGWAFASPMRAFSKPTSSNGKRDHHHHITRQGSEKNSTTSTSTPNLAAIPSLLTVRS